MRVILETERLILREYTEEDAPGFFQLNSDPDVMRYVPDEPLTNIDQAQDQLSNQP
jgi:RimJ/RimL family protein N-acetyltransferase